MGIASIIESVATNTVPQYVMVKYQETEEIGAGSDSTSLIIIDLPGLDNTSVSYKTEPRKLLSGKSYVIDLASFSISCLSANYAVRVLNKNDITLLNTTNEILSYTGVNLSTSENFDRFIIRNSDEALDNKLYLFISNSGIATGIITIELTYITIQDREF